MFKLFEKETTIAYLIFSILLVLLCIKVSTGQLTSPVRQDSFIYFLPYITKNWSAFAIRCSTLCIIFFSFFIFSLLYRQFSYHSKGGLIFLFVICVHTILALCFPFHIETTLIGFFFLVMSHFLVSTNQQKETTPIFFNLGLVFSLSLCISPSMLFYTIPLLFSLPIFGKNGLRDLCALAIGILTTFILIASIIWTSNQENQFINLLPKILEIKYKLLANWEWGLFVIGLLSAFLTFPKINLFTINTRKFYIYLFFCLLSSMLSFLFLTFNGIKNYILIMIIASFYYTPFLFKLDNYRLKNILLFFGFVLSFIAIFVQFK